MIVVDTNVVAYLLIAGDKTELAQQTFRQDPRWLLPSLWQHEFLNVLASFVRFGGGDLDAAEAIWQRSVRLFGGHARNVDMTHALHIAAAHEISAYDAQYVALALALNVPFVSEDRRLQQLFPALTQSLQVFCAND